jgi:hypothetical protein
MNRLLACSALLLLATSAGAQQRRSAGGGPPSQPREIIEPMPRYPFVGTWTGLMALPSDTMPLSVDIAVMNDKYTSVSYGARGGRINHLKTESAGTGVRWEIKNSGDGVWIYEARRIVGDTIFGTVKLDGMMGRDGQPPVGSIMLVRQRR